MSVYRIIYRAGKREYLMIIEASSEKNAKKKAQKFFEGMEFGDAEIITIHRVD